MVSLRACILGAVALSSSALGAFEPLAADDLFARAPAGFEPLEPSVTRRDTGAVPAAAGGHLPRAHRALQQRGASSDGKDLYSVFVAAELKAAIDEIKPLHSTVVSACASIKASGHKSNPVALVGSIQPHLAKCKGIVNKCWHHIGHPHPHPQPSGGYGGGPPGHPGWGPPGHHGCGNLLAELIKLIHDLIEKIDGVAKDIPILASLLQGYVESLDSELEELIQAGEAAVPGVQGVVVGLTSSLSGSLHHIGFGLVGDLLDHLL